MRDRLAEAIFSLIKDRIEGLKPRVEILELGVGDVLMLPTAMSKEDFLVLASSIMDETDVMAVAQADDVKVLRFP